MPDFDVVVLGGGTAGVLIATGLAQVADGTSLEGDRILPATGRRPRLGGLDLPGTARAAVEDDDRGRIELYADTTRGDMLVGATAVGLYAEEWMGELTLAIRAGLSLRMLADVVHAFPTYGEAIERSLRELATGVAQGDHR